MGHAQRWQTRNKSSVKNQAIGLSSAVRLTQNENLVACALRDPPNQSSAASNDHTLLPKCSRSRAAHLSERLPCVEADGHPPLRGGHNLMKQEVVL